MKGDFSRDTFDSRKNFSRVLMQQGRVQLDADWNEQTAILLHYLRTLAADLIGPHAGPPNDFVVNFLKDKKGDPTDLTVSAGHYYVDGILCENEREFNGAPVSYFNQPYYQPDDRDDKLPFPFMIYLDVWERHVTVFEDESLREVALGEVDTTTRSQIVWQVKLYKLTKGEEKTEKDTSPNRCNELRIPKKGSALLNARTAPEQISDDPCNIAPDARYRGAENQLYRVEIHTGNVDEFGREQDSVTPTFKWSRENGSIIFPVISSSISGDTTEVALANLGRDDKFDLREGDWVELADDAYALHNRAGKLLKISSIDRDEKSVTLDGAPAFPPSEDSANHPLLRRWDQQAGNPNEGGLTLNAEGDDADNAAEIVFDRWLTLEDGVQIQFPQPKAGTSGFRTGDYWLIPARTATGDVVWTKDASGNSVPQPAHGVEHHYAPLGIAFDAKTLTLCRCTLKPVSICPSAKDNGRGKGKDS